jgi:trans-2,3-dihydro-3-hydroxyanthranilate isomerase
VHEADGLGDETMGAFARETLLSETTFVQRPTADGADYRNRIFTVQSEIPFAGHPSLGTAVAVAARRGERTVSYVQETGSGLQPIDVRRGDAVWTASMLQGVPEFGTEVDARHVMAAVGLLPGDAHRAHPPQVVSTGLPTLIAPVAAGDALGRAEPDFDLIDHVMAGCGAVNLYLVGMDGGDAARARMFNRILFRGEDPATGSAAGPLCAYLVARGLGERVEITQGAELGRPSVLTAEMEGDRPRVSGKVVTVIEGTVSL